MNEIGTQILEFFMVLAGISELSELVAHLHALDQSIKNAFSLVGVATVVVGLLQCFFGFKLFKFWCGLIGFMVGATISVILFATGVFAESFFITVVGASLMLLLCITCAVIAYRAYLVGVFIYTAAAAFIVGFLGAGLITDSVNAGLIAGAITGLAIGVIGVIFRRFWIIVTTSVTGGISVSASLMMIWQSTDSPWGYLIAPVIITVGFIFQYFTVKDEAKLRAGKTVSKAHPSQLPPVYANAAAQSGEVTPEQGTTEQETTKQEVTKQEAPPEQETPKQDTLNHGGKE